MTEKTDDNASADYQRLLAERVSWLEQMRKSSDLFDKTLLLIAGGALTLSMAFLKDIAPRSPHQYTWLLVLGWFLLVGGLLITLIGMLFSVYSCKANITSVDLQITPPPDKAKLSCCWSRLTSISNWITLVLTIAGISLITIFASCNLY